jgi:hypothetical protein
LFAGAHLKGALRGLWFCHRDESQVLVTTTAREEILRCASNVQYLRSNELVLIGSAEKG